MAKKDSNAIIIRDSAYIPIRLLNQREVKEHYTTKMYEDKSCIKCDHFEERHSYICDTCEAYKGTVILHKSKQINGRSYIGLPLGDKRNFKDVTGLDLSKLKVKDRRQYAPFTVKFKMLVKPRDYQQPVIDKFMTKKYGLIKAPPRTGKCVVGDTYVHTAEHGMVPIRALFSADHKSGEYRARRLSIAARSGMDLTSHIYKERVSETVKVRTEFGFHVRGTPEHPMLVLTEDLRMVWKELKDISEGDVLCVQRQHATFAEKTPNGLTLEIARLLGYLTANGSLTLPKTFSFSSNNPRVQSDFIKCLKKAFGLRANFRPDGNSKVQTIFISSHEIRAQLQALGLGFTSSAGKVIPQLILSAPKKYVLAYLSAYFSCDSWMPTRTTDPIELCSASRKLIDQLHILLLQFGIVARQSSKISWARNSNNPTKRLYYYLHILSTEKNSFYSTFKLLKETGSISNRVRMDADKIPNLGFWLSEIHKQRYQRVGVYKTHAGDEIVSRHFGRLVENHEASPSELPEDLNYRVAHKINSPLLKKLSPKLEAKVSALLSSQYFFDAVVSKRTIRKPVTVYDVTVPDSHSFIANGLVSHNTFMMLEIAFRLGQRAVLLANQREYLTQFLDHIHGNEPEGIPKCTNLPELEEKLGRKLYGFPKKDEDFLHFQFFVMTYQQFISEKNGKDRFRKLAPNIGTVMVDEVDKSASPQFAATVSKFRTRYRFGVTATVKRKDNRHFIVESLIGPVVAESKREALTPTIVLHRTEFQPKRTYTGKAGYVYANQAMASDKKRIKLIVEWVMKDLKNGHNIVIPVMFKKQAADMVQKINEEYAKEFNTTKKIAAPFVGGTTKAAQAARDKVLVDAKANVVRVTVGIRSILQRGLNVPAWSAIYEIVPISNEPNLQQETKRVCTPMEGKRDPIVRLFVDLALGLSIGCARNSIKHMQNLKYHFKKSDKQRILMYEILGDKSGERDTGGNNDYAEREDRSNIPTRSLFDKAVTGNKAAPRKRF